MVRLHKMKDIQPAIKNPLLATLLQPRRMVFIVNPHSGMRLHKRIKESIDLYLNHRLFEYSIWFTEYPGHASELSRKAVAEGYEIVVAVGGDGSVNEVAAGLLHTKTQLGIIPAGSGNGLATHLGYSRNINDAIKKLNFAQPCTVDCGLLNGRPFVNVAGIGFDGLVSNLMKGEGKRGFFPYFFKSLQAGIDYRSKDCEIEINGEILKEKCFIISVANGPMYGYNVQIAPDAILDDGLLSIVVLKDVPKWQYFAAVPSTLNGRILEASFVQHYQADRLRIRCKGENYVHVDGEGYTTNDELNFEILPKSLEILVPVKK